LYCPKKFSEACELNNDAKQAIQRNDNDIKISPKEEKAILKVLKNTELFENSCRIESIDEMLLMSTKGDTIYLVIYDSVIKQLLSLKITIKNIKVNKKVGQSYEPKMFKVEEVNVLKSNVMRDVDCKTTLVKINEDEFIAFLCEYDHVYVNEVIDVVGEEDDP
jgi:hypothetical protein